MSVLLAVKERATRPRLLRNQLRHEGKIPGVLNGYQVDSTPIVVEERDLEKVLRDHGTNALISLDIAGKKVNALIHHVQTNTFTRKMTHVEFLSVNLKEETEVEAEIVLLGDAAGVKAGGILTQTLYTVLVSATPDKLPEKVELDISNMAIGDTLVVGDFPEAADFTITTDVNEPVATISEALTEELAEEVPAEPAAEE